MLNTIGLPELIIIAAIVLIVAGIGRRYSQRAPSIGVLAGGIDARGASSIPYLDWHTAVADERYRHGVRAGHLAELFGLGGDRVNRTQIIVVVIGMTLARSYGLLSYALVSRPDALDLVTMPYVASMIFTSMAFVVSAITAARSFRSGLSVSCATGAMYAGLVASMQWAFGPTSSASVQLAPWVPLLTAFTWGTLTMGALAIAVGRRVPWLRLLIALTVTSLIQSFITLGLYAHTWDLQDYVEGLFGSLSSATPGSSLITTATFWLGYRIRPAHERVQRASSIH